MDCRVVTRIAPLLTEAVYLVTIFYKNARQGLAKVFRHFLIRNDDTGRGLSLFGLCRSIFVTLQEYERFRQPAGSFQPRRRECEESE